MEKALVVMYITIDNRLYPEIYAPAKDASIMGLQLSLATTSIGLTGCLIYTAENFLQPGPHKKFNVPNHRYKYLTYLFGWHPAKKTLTTMRANPEYVATFI